MKRILPLILVSLFLILTLASCKADSPKTEPITEPETTEEEEPISDSITECEIACVSSPQSLSDSTSQAVINMVNEYAQSSSRKVCCWESKKDTLSSYLSVIKVAAESKAKLIVLTSDLFCEALAEAQIAYPTARFIIVCNKSEHIPSVVKNNTAVISAPHEIGAFLAGYAAVAEQKTHLAIMTGEYAESGKASVCGFLQGAQYAAAAKGLPDGSITVKLVFTSSENAANAATLLISGTTGENSELIFTCGSKMTQTALTAAQQSGVLVIGTDGDWTTAGKNMLSFVRSNSSFQLKEILEKAFDNSSWKEVCGKINEPIFSKNDNVLASGLVSNGTDITESFGKFTYFTADEYAALSTDIISGKIVISKETPAIADGSYPTAADFTSAFGLAKLTLLIDSPAPILPSTETTTK